MNEPYSRKLSEEAAAALIDFIEAYLKSLTATLADRQAEIAKQKAIDVLVRTDVDILVFVTTIATMHSPTGVAMMSMAVVGMESCRDIAIAIMRIMEEGFKRDKQARTG